MATSKAPKHDFAPAWLKIPPQENQKWSGGKQGDSGNRSMRNDDHYGTYHPCPTDYPYHPLTRQRSFDNYNDERPQSSQKFRHNSADDDYYSAVYGGYQNYYNSYNFDKCGPHYRSQPSLYRRGDCKYTHPNARFTQMTGGYQNHCVPYPYDFYGDAYYSSGGGYSGRLPGKGGNHDSRSGGPRSEQKEKRSTEQKSGNKGSLEEDFPSLKGEGKEMSSQSGNSSSSTGVWDKPSAKLLSGGHAAHSEYAPVSPDSFGKENVTYSKQNSSIYKSLVPNKGLLNRPPSRDTLRLHLATGSRDVNSNCSSKPSTPSHTPSPPSAKTSKEFQQIMLNGGTHQGKEVGPAGLEILNRRFSTQTKNLPDRKSQFLKTLKHDNSSPGVSNGSIHIADKSTWASEDMDGVVVNGVEHLTVSQKEAEKLSSSLEAEQRLLREMGWNETDEEDYEITEDDRKEFLKLTKQMKHKNGMQRSLPKTWSPQHMPVYCADAVELSDSMSTSSEDSDNEN